MVVQRTIGGATVKYIERMPREGETVEAPSFSMGFGGKGANQAVAAARLGASVMMVTKVGDDLFGPNTRDNLKSHGIDTRFVWTEPGTEAATGDSPASAPTCPLATSWMLI